MGIRAPLPDRLLRALRAKGLAVTDVFLGESGNRATWTVTPQSLQAAAQPHIAAFDPDDPALEEAERDDAAEAMLTDPLAEAFLDLLADASAPDVSGQIQLSAKGQSIQRDLPARNALRAKLKGHLRRRMNP